MADSRPHEADAQPGRGSGLADDFAVAYSKLGRHAEGIVLLEQVLAAHPDRYETLANLGTIHMLAGDLKVGKEYIDRAIVINPNAHLAARSTSRCLPSIFLPRESRRTRLRNRLPIVHPKGESCGFAKFVLEKRGLPTNTSGVVKNDKGAEEVKAELAAAQKGVLGMMHFANYDSPLLLEALGDLLIAWPTHQDDALQLAARAYYRVAQLSDDERRKTSFK